MKPGRLQNALKSFGRASKCIKILWSDSKFSEMSARGFRKLQKSTKIQKMWFFRHKMVKIMIFGTTFGPTFHRKTTFENTVWRGYCLLMSKFCNIWNHMAPLVIKHRNLQKFWHPKVLDERIKKHDVLQNQVVQAPQKHKSPKSFLKSSSPIL